MLIPGSIVTERCGSLQKAASEETQHKFLPRQVSVCLVSCYSSTDPATSRASNELVIQHLHGETTDMQMSHLRQYKRIISQSNRQMILSVFSHILKFCSIYWGFFCFPLKLLVCAFVLLSGWNDWLYFTACWYGGSAAGDSYYPPCLHTAYCVCTWGRRRPPFLLDPFIANVGFETSAKRSCSRHSLVWGVTLMFSIL